MANRVLGPININSNALFPCVRIKYLATLSLEEKDASQGCFDIGKG